MAVLTRFDMYKRKGQKKFVVEERFILFLNVFWWHWTAVGVKQI